LKKREKYHTKAQSHREVIFVAKGERGGNGSNGRRKPQGVSGQNADCPRGKAALRRFSKNEEERKKDLKE